jgi:hypothetical protein
MHHMLHLQQPTRLSACCAALLQLCFQRRLRIFELFPVLLGILLSWFIAWLLTISGVYNSAAPAVQAACRTDQSNVLFNSPWFRFPYPGQWGPIHISWASTLTMLAGRAVVLRGRGAAGRGYSYAARAEAPLGPGHWQVGCAACVCWLWCISVVCGACVLGPRLWYTCVGTRAVGSHPHLLGQHTDHAGRWAF